MFFSGFQHFDAHLVAFLLFVVQEVKLWKYRLGLSCLLVLRLRSHNGVHQLNIFFIHPVFQLLNFLSDFDDSPFVISPYVCDLLYGSEKLAQIIINSKIFLFLNLF